MWYVFVDDWIKKVTKFVLGYMWYWSSTFFILIHQINIKFKFQILNSNLDIPSLHSSSLHTVHLNAEFYRQLNCIIKRHMHVIAKVTASWEVCHPFVIIQLLLPQTVLLLLPEGIHINGIIPHLPVTYSQFHDS